jgi:hypothetical protein
LKAEEMKLPLTSAVQGCTTQRAGQLLWGRLLLQNATARLRSVSWMWLKTADGSVWRGLSGCGNWTVYGITQQRTLRFMQVAQYFYLSDMQDNVMSRALCWVC